jgi:predicted nucleic acid-binding protein
MRWCFENATHPYAESVLQTLITGEAIVPVMWRYEVSAVLAKVQKTGIIAKRKADTFLEQLQKLNIITMDGESAERILTDVHRLAVTYRLTSYDAAYLELAVRRKLPLATLDAELLNACKLSGETVL